MRAIRFAVAVVAVSHTLSPLNFEEGIARAQSSNHDPVVAVCGSEVLKASELDARAVAKLSKLKAEEYRIQRSIIEAWIAERALAHAASQKQMSVEELLRAEVDSQVAPVTTAEAQAVLEHSGQSVLGGLENYEAAVASIQRDLLARRVAIRKQQFVWRLRNGESAKVLLTQPRVVVDVTGKRFRGKASAPVTIVVFADYECPFCAKLAPILDGITARFGDDVRVIHQHFPLDSHKNAAKSAEAAECAGEQGQFWEMNDLLYKNRQHLSVPDLKGFATELKLDSVRFDRCLDSSRMAAIWRADKTAGESYGINGTPTLFINGRMLPGIPNDNTLALVVQEELTLSRER